MIRIFLRLFLLIVFLSNTSSLFAQKKSFNKGYIIERNGDTIMGLVKDRSPEPFVSLYNKIRFKKEGSRRTRKYSPNEILGYGSHGQNFVSIPFREESAFFKFRYYSDASASRVFLKVIRRSKKLIYFEQLFTYDDNCYLDSIPFFYRPNSREFVRVTQGILGFKRKHLAEYFSDCPVLIEELYSKNSRIKSVPALYEFCLDHCAQ